MDKLYTKQEVENLIREIIDQDSFGDVHWQASKVANREGLDISKREET